MSDRCDPPSEAQMFHDGRMPAKPSPNLPRCEPPEKLRGVDGWHWVKHESVEAPTMATWEMPEWWPETGGAWRIGSHLYMPQPAHKKGWRYLAPVTPPAEVDALREERAAMEFARDTFARELDTCAVERATLRATVAQLREALERIAIHGGWMSRSPRDVARDALAAAEAGE